MYNCFHVVARIKKNQAIIKALKKWNNLPEMKFEKKSGFA